VVEGYLVFGFAEATSYLVVGIVLGLVVGMLFGPWTAPFLRWAYFKAHYRRY